MHSNRRLRPKRERAQKTFDRDKTSSCELPIELTPANRADQWAHRAESKWPWATAAPIHNTFLMSFDVELPFFAGFAPFFVLFYRCKRANDPLCLCDNLLSVRSFLSPSFCLLSPPSRPVWDWQTGKKPIHDSLPGMKPNKLKSAQYFMTDQNWHNLVNCCHRQKQAWIFSNRKRCSRSDQL